MASLQTAAASAAADQAVIVRYASEVTRERDALLQRTAELEAKWITAECRNVVFRQHIAELLVRVFPATDTDYKPQQAFYGSDFH